MSTNLNYKQATNVERRTWDLEVYEKKAKERGESTKKKEKKLSRTKPAELGEKRFIDEVEDDSNKEEFIAAPKGAAGPKLSKRAFLKARRNRVDVDSKVGTIEMINPDAAATTKAFEGEEGSIKVRFGVCNCCWCCGKLAVSYADYVPNVAKGWNCEDRSWMALQSL